MDLSQLKSLGEVAGIGGLAIGVVVLLVRPLIDKLGIVPAAQRGPLFRLISSVVRFRHPATIGVTVFGALLAVVGVKLINHADRRKPAAE